MFKYPGEAQGLRITNRGSDNFVVQTYGDDGDLLVNEIGNYSGDIALGAGPELIQIQSDGHWTLKPPAEPRVGRSRCPTLIGDGSRVATTAVPRRAIPPPASVRPEVAEPRPPYSGVWAPLPAWDPGPAAGRRAKPGSAATSSRSVNLVPANPATRRHTSARQRPRLVVI